MRGYFAVMELALYRTFSRLFSPLIDLYLRWRVRQGKEDATRFPERLGHAGYPRPSGSLVWVHAASVGETMAVFPLIEKLLDSYPDIHLLITTGTVTSAKVVKARLPKRAMHQYVPVDKVVTVRRFLEHWRPNLALWVESELWPNLVIETHHTGCTLIQVNARMSLASYQKWQRYNKIARRMLGCFTLSLAQSEQDRERLAFLGAQKPIDAGNLKLDAPPLPADPKQIGTLLPAIGDRMLWVAASTHPGEEELIIKAHQALLKQYPDLLTMIIPRHPERGKEVVKLAEQAGQKAQLRSASEDMAKDTAIYVADTIGELGIFYRLSSIVFMGGSLVKHGGQNPLEPARLECALLTGPYTENFAASYDELLQHQAVVRVTDADGLALKVAELLQDHERCQKMASAAADLMATKTGVLGRYMEYIRPYLKPLSRANQA